MKHIIRMKPIACLLTGLFSIAFLAVPAQAQARSTLEELLNRDSAEIQMLGIFEQYLRLVEHLAVLVKDPTATGVASVLGASDILKSQGPQAGIDYFIKILPQVKNESIRRTIRLQLADLYKNNNQQDKALEELRGLIIETPTGESAQ